MVATTQTVAVAAPFVQPVVTVGAVTPSTIVLNKFGSVSVTVTNNGNVTASGITLTLSPSTDGISPIDGDVLDTVTLKGVRIPAGRKQVFRLRFKVTSAVASGAFFPYMSVSLNGVLATAVGAGQFTVAGTGV
jgi:hypothetical protein